MARLVEGIGRATMALMMALVLAAAAPSAEAEALGRRIANAGLLGTLLPMMVKKDTDELVARHKELTAAEQAELRRIAQRTASSGIDKALSANGHAYAEALSVDELKAVAAFMESPAGQRWRASQPQVIAGTVAAIEGMDFKKDVAAAYCKQTGKLCD
ncbi:DUF2059 domain-containing protein [Sphingomonas piscis]|uniref:DUF2059 domain-containing protein n=1 Tax=Sphingomonas piscis TaxID=2714943 RepID=A0A6G7YQP9_9SPHN|nr:DUF2059 domain-containing protein [Sphingomonas piscis]QIK79057.1 DUF2059 domain-containing protein [Sphingomonas piscis]